MIDAIQKNNMKTNMKALGVVSVTVEKQPNTNTKKKIRLQLPLRDCAHSHVYEFLMSQKRPKHVAPSLFGLEVGLQ